jgi:hypothetical protein
MNLHEPSGELSNAEARRLGAVSEMLVIYPYEDLAIMH